MNTVSVSHLLRYGSSYHGDFEKISDGSFLLVTRYGNPHVVIAPGMMAPILNVFAKAEKNFIKMSFDERLSVLSELKQKNNLRDFIKLLAEEK